MKIFQITAPEGYDWVLPISAIDYDALRFDGRSCANGWTPIGMHKLTVDDRGQLLSDSDFPSCSGGEMLLVRQRAVDALGDVLRMHGELLPLSCDDGVPIWILNITKFVDALDEDKSDLLRMPNSGEIVRIKVPYFRRKSIGCAEIFKLRSMPRGLIYVTEPFVERVKSADLIGIDFRNVWNGT
jgi:hypothetical protein